MSLGTSVRQVGPLRYFTRASRLKTDRLPPPPSAEPLARWRPWGECFEPEAEGIPFTGDVFLKGVEAFYSDLPQAQRQYLWARFGRGPWAITANSDGRSPEPWEGFSKEVARARVRFGMAYSFFMLFWQRSATAPTGLETGALHVLPLAEGPQRPSSTTLPRWP
jgi:hypothetical protein